MNKLFTTARTLAAVISIASGSSAFAQSAGTSSTPAPTSITGNTTISASYNTLSALALGNLNTVTNTNASIHQNTTIKGNTSITADHNTLSALALGNLNTVRNANGSIGAP